MAFEKRVCVLKQIKKGFTADGSALSGAVYVERLGSELTIVPRLLGIAPVKEGRYALAIGVGGEVLITELDKSGSTRMEGPSIASGFSVLLVYLRGDAEPVAFGSCGLASNDYGPLLAAFSEREKRKNGAPMPAPTPLPPTELPTFSPNNVPLAPTVPLPGEEEERRPFREAEQYNDEAIADANYYEDPTDGHGTANDVVAEAEEAARAQIADDADAVHPLLVGGGLTYYHSVREKLREAFEKFPKDERLLSVYPTSEWVKADGALLGIIYKNGSPEFLCVAVEAEGDPPEEMKGHCQFVPATPFSDMVGFYIVYQSASTGEYVTISDS